LTDRAKFALNMHRRCSLIAIVLALLVSLVPAVRAQDGLRGALSRSAERAGGGLAIGQQIVAADFDNDQNPDGAVLLEAGQLNGEKAFRIELHMTAGKNATIDFSSAETRLAISALDVNRDGAPDILIEKAFTHQRLQVYLNDGHGAFHRETSQSFPGPDDSEPLWQTPTMNPQNLPMLFLPVTRGFELARAHAAALPRERDAPRMSFWPEVLLAQCGPRAPSASRAPPSRLSL
jgi:hypothetical protein